MTESSRLVALDADRARLLRCVVSITVIIFAFLVASATTKADTQPYSVVVQVHAKSTGLTSGEIVVRIGNISMPATAIKASPDIPRNIAIVIDAGPDQAKVLAEEKELAIALINELGGAGTSFTIVEAGSSPKTHATTLDTSVAIEDARDISEDRGEKRNVPSYDAIGSAIRKISLFPGLRVVVFIGEGNDGGSKLRYADLRNLAESNQIAFCAALVADHTLRGAKSLLRYGWNLRELTDDTAGIFLENQKPPKATRRLIETIRDLLLITFDMNSPWPGRHKVSILVRSGKRLRAQNFVVVP